MTGAEALPEADELRAAELALGLLEGADQADAVARRAADPRFAAAVDRWAAQFLGLLAGYDRAPPPSLWRRIEDRLPANDVAGPGRDRTLRWWQAGTMAASLAAAILAVVAIGHPFDRAAVQVAAKPTPPPLVAILAGDGQASVVTVSFDPASGRLVSAPSKLDVGAHSAELWVIAAGGSPRSLGVIAAGLPSRRDPPAGLAHLIAPDATLAITVEPVGGSPSGAPTGPVILSGKIVSL